MKHQSEHKNSVRQENETTANAGLVFWLLFHSPVLLWSCVLSVVSFSCLTVVLCSDWCFILLSYSGPLVLSVVSFSYHTWSCVLSVVSFSCLTMILCSDCCFILLSYGGLVFWLLFYSPVLRWSGEWNNGQNTRPPQDRRMKQQSEHKTIVRQEDETTDRTQDQRKTGE
jgi:hypothetical protein